MKQVTVDFSNITGTIRPMHATNNGPFRSVRGGGQIEGLAEMGIPCIRNHDAALTASCGGPHTVDVLNIFPNFDADENDPANYDFVLTDEYCKLCCENGRSILYRLGSKIEHEKKKYHTLPPRDFFKYARICEHIIRHLLYDWADGLHLNIPYWEIWNEADNYHEDGSNPCWGGTEEEFLSFYEIMAKYLKGCFPELKIGGPAYTGSHARRDYMERFVAYAAKHKIPLDFFSWHGYRHDPRDYGDDIRFARDLLDRFGFTETKTVLDEWNYIRGWRGEDMTYSYQTMKNEKGAAFVSGSMLVAQKAGLDMFMYYDARPGTGFNGMFEQSTLIRRKPYYAFWQFNRLYRLHDEAESRTDDENLYVGAAAKDGHGAVQLAYFSDEDAPEVRVAIVLKGLPERAHLKAVVTDRTHDNDTVFECVCAGTEATVYLDLACSSTLLLTSEPV